MKVQISLLVPLILFFSQPAQPQQQSHVALMSIARLQEICEAGLANPNPGNWNYSYCAGLAVGIIYTDVMQQQKICAPAEADTQTTLRLFVERAKREKNKSLPGAVSFYLALLEKYPCKP